MDPKLHPLGNSTHWRCHLRQGHTKKCEFHFVETFRLPKSQMAMLRSLRANLKTIDRMIPQKSIEEVAFQVTASTLVAALTVRQLLLAEIQALEEWGIERFQNHIANPDEDK